MMLRIITAILAILSIKRFAFNNLSEIKPQYKTLFLWLSFFLWFLPYINVRFNSESWSGLLFLLAIGFVKPNAEAKISNSVLIGCMCGLSFLCRFQIGIMFLGFCLWLLLVKRENRRTIILIIVSFIFVIIFGVLLDRIYYKEWTLSFWNYFNVNILHDVSSTFGTISWYNYIIELLYKSIFPIGILIFSCFIIFIVELPKSLILWIIVPLIFIHIIIPHKETRFIFPIVNYFPFIIIKGLQQAYILYPAFFAKLRKVIFVFILLIAVNAVALLISIFIPPSGGGMAITKYIYDNFHKRPIKFVVFSGEERNPFQPYSFLQQSFYSDNKIRTISIASKSSIYKIPYLSDSLIFLVVKRSQLSDPDFINEISALNFKIVKEGIPNWSYSVMYMYDHNIVRDEYVLYRKLTNK